MKKRINTQFAIISLVAILFTVGLATIVYYDMFRKEVIQSLKTYTHVLKSSGIFENDSIDNQLGVVDELRVTLVNKDGTIAFESNADIGKMDNHSHRPEILQAAEEGEGEAVRKSTTRDKNMFYYAVKLDNGQILRVAKEAESMTSFWISMLPFLAVTLLCLLPLCLVLGHFLTRSIINPIEDMALHIDEEGQKIAYKEMQPFIDTIQKQHRDIVKSSQIRQEFTANVSHELKTPLTAISGYSELIESGITTTEDSTRFAGEIHKSSKRLLTLINDIIRLSELDITEDIVQTELLNLYELAEKCVDMMQVSAEKHEVTLILGGSQCMIRANREMMEELLYNLCSNAIRYNVPGGRVVVNVERRGEEGILTVEDTGIGIPKEDQERIFERFYRVDKSRSKSTGGTGLGLAIVKHIVAKHHARIELTSRVGAGTRIRVILPR